MKKNNRCALSRLLFASLLAFGFIAFSGQPVSAQYGNLISKAAMDAMAAGDYSLCRKEALALRKESFDSGNTQNRVAAEVEVVRCGYLAVGSDGFAARMKKQYLTSGKSETEARALAEADLTAGRNSLRTAIDAIILSNPSYAPAYNLRGEINLLIGKEDDAYSDFGRAMRYDPKDYHSYINQGRLAERSYLPDAIENYEKAIALGANDPYIIKRLPELRKEDKKQAKTLGNTDVDKYILDDKSGNSEMIALRTANVEVRLSVNTMVTSLKQTSDKNNLLQISENTKTKAQTALADVVKVQSKSQNFSAANKKEIVDLTNFYTGLIKKIDSNLARLRQ